MAAEQHDRKVDDHDGGQQPGRLSEDLTSSLTEQELQGIATSFTDLPQPWLKVLIPQLGSHGCQVLFSTCRVLAATVAQHSTGLTLCPHSTLQQDSNRRGFVLELAANSKNVHLHVHQQPIPLDVAAVWPCVKQLTMDGVSFTPEIIISMHLEQLTELHTMGLIRGLSLSSLRHLLQGSQLPAHQGSQLPAHPRSQLPAHQGSQLTEFLNAVTEAIQPPMAMSDQDEFQILQKLGPVIGERVTNLVVDSPAALRAIRLWPCLKRVQLEPSLSLDSTTIQHIFDHPQVKEAVVPHNMLDMPSNITASAKRLQSLHLTGGSGVSVGDLLQIPLHVVQRLQFHVGVHAANQVSEAEVQHLNQCPGVEVIPGTWGEYSMRSGSCYDCLPSDTPTWELYSDPALLQWLLPHISTAEGALVIYRDPCVPNPGILDMASLSLIPHGVHSLALDNCLVDRDCTWAQLVAQVPQHVRFLLLRRCVIKQAQFEAILAHPSPAGLRSITLAYDSNFMAWVDQPAEVLEGLVATNWPGVELKLVFDECIEDLFDRLEAWDEDKCIIP